MKRLEEILEDTEELVRLHARGIFAEESDSPVKLLNKEHFINNASSKGFPLLYE